MPKKLPLSVFLKTFKLNPRAAVSLIIIDQEDRVLLAKRTIPPNKGKWRIPGAFILRGEKISACIERIFKDELGIKVRGTSGDLIGVFEDLEKDPRGHIVELVYRFRIFRTPRATTHAREWKFFTALPKGVEFRHGGILKSVGYHR